nr:putative retrotransposon Ty1-copia subclass protein [Tanacetum cinerariifolium]
MQEKLKLSKSQGASTPVELKRMQNVPYASAVGSIVYAQRFWVRKFISRLGVVPTIDKPISMYCDNTKAIAIANELGITEGDLCKPANYKAALLDPESEKSLNAMNVETQSMKDNEVWVLVELPPNGKTVGSKWLFKKKNNMDGVIHTYKARLVANGYT